jgi:hypothetical protein
LVVRAIDQKIDIFGRPNGSLSLFIHRSCFVILDRKENETVGILSKDGFDEGAWWETTTWLYGRRGATRISATLLATVECMLTRYDIREDVDTIEVLESLSSTSVVDCCCGLYCC